MDTSIILIHLYHYQWRDGLTLVCVSRSEDGLGVAFYNGIRCNYLEIPYVLGVSLTHEPAGRRRHIWTFAAAFADGYLYSPCICGCSNTNHMSIILYDVGHDYFCDNNTQYNKEYGETRDDSWDGKTCGPSSSCCEWNDPLCFCKHLHHTTFDDREIGLFSYDYFYRPVTVSLIEIFVSRNSNKYKNITSHIASYCLCQPTYTLHY